MAPAVSIRLLYRVNNSVGFGLALLLNALLLTLILLRTPSTMRVYSIILVQACAVDALFATSLFLDTPAMLAVNQSLVKFPLGFFGTGMTLPWAFLFMLFSPATLIFSFPALGVQFVYRYLVVVREARITARHYLSMLLIPTAIVIAFIPLLYAAFYPSSPEAMAPMAALVAPVLNEPPDDIVVSFIGARSNPAFGVYSTSLMVLYIGTYVLIVWCNYRCWAHLRLARRKQVVGVEAKERQRLDKQVGWALIVQAAIPLATVELPAVVNTSAGVLQWPAEVYG